jgi:hypothetical protein
MLFVRGKRAAVILSAESYDALLALRPTIVDRLLEGPAFDDAYAESVILRAKAPGRAIEF